MDHYLRFVNGVQALRRRTEGLSVALGGALGVAADPLPHQLATVRRVLSDTHVRHLLSDEVGLGKTVQALMIVNALRWQDPRHRTLVIAPDSLLAQWQEESWIRAHVMPALAGVASGEDAETAPLLLARPRDLVRRQGEAERVLSLDASTFDLLIVDEPQTMPRETVQMLSQAADDFRQVLVLSATPRLGDTAWRELIMRMLEPEAALQARLEGRSLDVVLADREAHAIDGLSENARPEERAEAFLRAAAGRRVIRNGRDGWGPYLPVRKNIEIRVQPLTGERDRHEIAAAILQSATETRDLQGQPWTTARALQRSARAARGGLAAIAEQGGPLGAWAERARTASLEDPGDSRLEALLDILSGEWQRDAARTFIVVCGDNPTIDMLRIALPRYFPDLADGIAVLRRPAAGEIEAVTNLREVQETLAPLLEGSARLLLVGDWVQAGLNLHHVASRIIFYSLPWELESIDQLIGRVDRLGSSSARKKRDKNVRIWRIVQDGAQEAAIADLAAGLGVFDAPLPPLSDQERGEVQEALARSAISRDAPTRVIRVTRLGTGLPTRLTEADPYTPERAIAEYEAWRRMPIVEPAMLGAKQQDREPIANAEAALRSWLETISRSADFEIGSRPDQIDTAFRFNTIWYYRPGGRGRPADIPFLLPDTGTDNWMSDHQPYILDRSGIPVPPRKTVISDAGEESGRPLHFLDHGSRLHDALVAGYAEEARRTFGSNGPVVSATVILPEGHPAKGLGPALITIGAFDPFPDEMLPALWSSEAENICASAPSDAQREALTADRRILQSMARAIQRWVRLNVSAELCRIGSVAGAAGWSDLRTDQVDSILRPLISGPNGQCAKGRKPMHQVLSANLIVAERQRQISKVKARARNFEEEARQALLPLVSAHMSRLVLHWKAEADNRERALERRRNSPPETGPRELWQGQVAALERSLEMSRLCGREAIAILQEFAAGRRGNVPVEPISILLSFPEHS
ncbi:SNF2-related protein [Sinorhizobium fredii]|uniref:SNF2-related protein n=1 Tax=Rhizobium fredii TaxID=380 RepID=UPI0004B2AA90|nr:SNF2-related protein [Sinorhizobium fredii]AWM23736.1 helicase domain protein [Sinorhizobium fredii CCBAU 25509]